MIEGTKSFISSLLAFLILSRGTKSIRWRPKDHGDLCGNWHCHRVHLFDCPALCRRQYGAGCHFFGRTSPADIDWCNQEQSRCYLPSDVHWPLSFVEYQLMARLGYLSSAWFLLSSVSWLPVAEWFSLLPGKMTFRYIIRTKADEHRDGGLPASKFFAKVHPTLKLPLNALILTVVVVICFGCIFLGSSRWTISLFKI